MAHPSLFEVVIEKACIGYRYRIEKNGEWIVPDEYSSTPRALTLRGARHKAARWIEQACTPPSQPEQRIRGDELIERVEVERFADSMV